MLAVIGALPVPKMRPVTRSPRASAAGAGGLSDRSRQAVQGLW